MRERCELWQDGNCKSCKMSFPLILNYSGKVAVSAEKMVSSSVTKIILQNKKASLKSRTLSGYPKRVPLVKRCSKFDYDTYHPNIYKDKRLRSDTLKILLGAFL